MISAWESAVEAQIRSAVDRGEFDNLPGAGKPIPGRNQPYDESWWIKSFLEREALSTDLLLPTPLLLRRKAEQLPDEVRDLLSEQAVRTVVADLNTEIMAWLRNPDGPRVVVRPVDADAVVRQWRAHREAARPVPTPAPADGAPVADRPRRRRVRLWWRRRS